MNPYQYTQNNIFLAPLAGITDAAFRLLCSEQGAGLTFTEMISAKGFNYGNERTRDLLRVLPGEGKVGVQLFGSIPKQLAKTAQTLEQEYGNNIALFDINMGCPVPKIVNNNEGAALMKDPLLAAEIVHAVKKAVSLPVTVKFRKGYSMATVNAVEFGLTLEKAGADALTVHGRSREQFYEGKADWDIIRDVKKAVGIPVNGNGDIYSGADAQRMFKHTSCDGIMVARGALGNPFIFREIVHFLHTGETIHPTTDEKLNAVIQQMELLLHLKGERTAILEMRKHAAWYIKGIKGAARMRQRLVRAESIEEMKELMCACLEKTD